MNYLTDSGIKAIGFDAFGTLIDDSKRPKFNLSKIFNKYGLSLKKTNLMTKSYSKEPEIYYQELFDFLFQLEGKGRTYHSDVSQEDKNLILENFEKEIKSYVLRPQTEEFLEKIKSEINDIFLISNLSSVYINKVEELLKGQKLLFKIYSCEHNMQKTIKNSDIFNLSSTILNNKSWKIIQNNEILFSGDKKSNDIIAPINAGFQAIHIEDFREIILNQ